MPGSRSRGLVGGSDSTGDLGPELQRGNVRWVATGRPQIEARNPRQDFGDLTPVTEAAIVMRNNPTNSLTAGTRTVSVTLPVNEGGGAAGALNVNALAHWTALGPRIAPAAM